MGAERSANDQPCRRPPLAAHPVLIAQISDLHITPPGQLAYGRIDTTAALMRSIDTLNRMSPSPDRVVISGDIANSALPEEYKHAKSLLGALRVPFTTIPGNHGRRMPMRSAFPGAYVTENGALNAMREVHGLDVFRTGIVYSDAIGLRNSDALATLLRKHPRARLVAAGHVHRAAQTVFAGISATTCPAGEQAVPLDFEPRWPEVYRIEPPALHLHAWLPGENFGSVVTHIVPVGDFPGPYSYGYAQSQPPQL